MVQFAMQNLVFSSLVTSTSESGLRLSWGKMGRIAFSQSSGIEHYPSHTPWWTWDQDHLLLDRIMLHLILLFRIDDVVKASSFSSFAFPEKLPFQKNQSSQIPHWNHILKSALTLFFFHRLRLRNKGQVINQQLPICSDIQAHHWLITVETMFCIHSNSHSNNCYFLPVWDFLLIFSTTFNWLTFINISPASNLLLPQLLLMPPQLWYIFLFILSQAEKIAYILHNIYHHTWS